MTITHYHRAGALYCEQAGLAKLGLTFQERGTVWVKDVQRLQTLTSRMRIALPRSGKPLFRAVQVVGAGERERGDRERGS
jgi:hypothetical protein